ncbi:MAG: hypothetical protein F6K39_30365 [Okeania sp. SIO3B3]|nr:hypothetical protein [Okeania sp. SIO3B3]
MERLTSEKQKYQCQACQRQFIANNQKKYISDETKTMMDKLLLEKISLAGIIC